MKLNKSLQHYKNYKCESCGKSFSIAGYLKRHIQIVHEEHKDHKCESCGKSFSKFYGKVALISLINFPM